MYNNMNYEKIRMSYMVWLAQSTYTMYIFIGTCIYLVRKKYHTSKVYGNPESYVKSEYVLLICTLNRDQLVFHMFLQM